MTEYHHLIHRQTYGLFYKTAVYGGNEYGKSGHLFIFTSLKHLKEKLPQAIMQIEWMENDF